MIKIDSSIEPESIMEQTFRYVEGSGNYILVKDLKRWFTNREDDDAKDIHETFFTFKKFKAAFESKFEVEATRITVSGTRFLAYKGFTLDPDAVSLPSPVKPFNKRTYSDFE